MSEKLLKFLLAELRTIRIVCRVCRTATDIPLSELARRAVSLHCAGCGAAIRSFHHGSQSDDFTDLASVLARLDARTDCEVQLVFPDG